jgi:NAD(P)-dependent dehydrogenase (short-subunit alcohol dehydrogenase family)
MHIELKPVEDQVVVLMGASSGIGREAAKLFARRGARVVVSARDETGLQSLVDEILEDGGIATYIVADVTDFNQVEQVASHAYQTYGSLDTWVHLAAVALYATFEETTPEEFRQVLDVNLLGQVHGAKAALPYLRRQGGGALIHISSIEGVRSLPYHAAYGASKHGVNGFLEALRLELQHEGIPISVTNIMPGSINTPFFNKARTKIGVMPKGLPPIYSPHVVAETIVYAAENPVADMYAGDSARMMANMQRMSPRLMDAYLLSTAFTGQRTDRPKSENAPDNLYAPLEGYDRVDGDFRALPVSISDELRTNSMVRAGIVGLLVGAAAAALKTRMSSRNADEAAYDEAARIQREQYRSAQYRPERYRPDQYRRERYQPEHY